MSAIDELKAVMITTEYKEGVWDCAQMVAWYAGRLDGEDHQAKVVGKYRTKLEGLRWLVSLKPGARRISEVVPEFLGKEWREVERTRPGDLVKMICGGVGIMTERGILECVPGKKGFCILAASYSRGGWRYCGGEAK